jgi:transcriptional antiterminator RfaH
MREERWYAIHTKARREGFASVNLAALGIETLLPKMRMERLVRGVPVTMTKALFPRYLFARFCPESLLESVEYTNGVLHVVKSGRFPIPVHEQIVVEIQERMDPGGVIWVSPPALQPGDRMTILGVPFEGMLGRVKRELDDRKRVEILLENLLNARMVIEKRWLEPASA